MKEKNLGELLDQVTENARILKEKRGIELDKPTKDKIFKNVQYQMSDRIVRKIAESELRNLEDGLGLVLKDYHPNDRSVIIDKIRTLYKENLEKGIQSSLKDWDKEVRKFLK